MIFGENFVIWFTIPINLHSSVTEDCDVIAKIAAVFRGSGEMPCHPRKVIWVWENWHFSAFSVTPALFIRLMHCPKSPIMLPGVAPNTRMSSTWHNTPGRPDRMLLMWCWKTSGALDIPNGSLLKQKWPYGVIKVVSNQDSLTSGICQNPLLASSLVNIVAPVSCARVVSTLGIGCTSCKTFSFRGFMSTHM